MLLSSTLAWQLDPDLQGFFFFFKKKKKKKEFFSDSKFPPSYPPTDTILFRTGDNFIHLHIIVSNSIGKPLQHASELGRMVMSSFPYPHQPPMRWDFYRRLCTHEMNTVTKIISNKCFTTLWGHCRYIFPCKLPSWMEYITARLSCLESSPDNTRWKGRKAFVYSLSSINCWCRFWWKMLLHHKCFL